MIRTILRLLLASPIIIVLFIMMTFHLYSTIAVVLLGAFVWILVKPNKPDSKKSLTIGW